MSRSLRAPLLVAALFLAAGTLAAQVPPAGAADTLLPAGLVAEGETVATLGAASLNAAGLGDRFVPAAPGTQRELTFYFGPITVPPGHDLNRVTTDIPVRGGFVTSVLARAIDVETLSEPSNMVFHIHHFLWLKPDTGGGSDLTPLHDYLFASGEERTRLDLAGAAAAVEGGPRYGIYVAESEPHTLVYMLHNKLARTATTFIRLDVTFVDGSAEEIAAAKGCANLLDAMDTCVAGAEFRATENRLWGSIFDVPRAPGGSPVHVHPRNGQRITMPAGGTLVSMTGHVHPGGKELVVANLGPAGSACEADLDGDGFAGVTIFRSRKVDRVAAAAPFSEDFQMETTHAAWRAPVRAGDRIAQFAVYLDDEHATYDAMSILAQHFDAHEVPAPRGGPCSVANTRAYLTTGDPRDPTRGVLSRDWEGDVLPLCGPAFGSACDTGAGQTGGGLDAKVVHIGGFAYLPGDRNFIGPLGAPPKVKQGESLTFVNEDAAAIIRHTVTSCAWPCDGPYRANYPLPDGVFDSGRLGNMDVLDQGGPWTEEANPTWETPTTLEPGLYSYYCRLHPTMRGAFEVVA